MRIIAPAYLFLAYLFLLCPISAAQSPSKQQYQDRLAEREKQIAKMHAQINSALCVKGDTLTLTKEQIREESSRLPTEKTFQEELAPILIQLRTPQEVLSEEQRRGLIAYPNFEHFQPLDALVATLENFIAKWQTLAAHSDTLQLCVRQTLWYNAEWAGLVLGLNDKLTRKTMVCEDLSKIYAWLSYFHTERSHLATSLCQLANPIPDSLNHFNTIYKELLDFFNIRGTVLWEIIRHSDLVRDSEYTTNLPLFYDKLPTDFFLDQGNPIKKVISSANAADSVSILVAPKSKSSSPKDTQEPLLLLEATRDVEGGSLVQRLGDAFVLPDQWERKVAAFQERALLLTHANIITRSLKTLSDYYTSFKSSYLHNFASAHDVFAPRALLNIYSLPPRLIWQTIAKRASRLKTNGPLCFNLPDTSNINRIVPSEGHELSTEATHGWDTPTNGPLLFRRKPTWLANNSVGTEQAMSLLECLFGIYDSEPIVPMVIENVRFFKEKKSSGEEVSENFVTETLHNQTRMKFSSNPSAWEEQSRFTLVTAHRNLEAYPLSTFLEKVSLGEDSFDRMDRYRFGLELLFSMVTQSTRTLENYGFEEKENGKLHIRRVGPSDIMAPLFKKLDDLPHFFIGMNALYYLPLVDEEIQATLKDDFRKNSILHILSMWLFEQNKLKDYFDPIIMRYDLDTPHENDEDMRVNLTKARMLGLSTALRPETICHIIQNFLVMARELEKPSITYRQLLMALRPVEGQCIQAIKEKAERKIRETFFQVLFTDIIPLTIAQHRKEHSETNTSGRIPQYSMDELAAFDSAANMCFSRYHGFESTAGFEPTADQPITFGDFITAIAATTPPNNFVGGAERTRWNIDTTTFFGQVMPYIITQLRSQNLSSSKKDDSPPLYSLEDLTEFEQLAKACLDQSQKTPLALIQTLPTKASGFFQHRYDWLARSGTFFQNCFATSSKWANERKDIITFFEKVIPFVIGQLRKLRLQEASLGESPISLDLILLEAAAKECVTKAKVSVNTSLKELISDLPSNISEFLAQKYQWWVTVKKAPEAKLTLKAWEILLSENSRNDVETLISSVSGRLPLNFWENVTVRTNRTQHELCQSIECVYPVSNMVQDLISHADLSSLPHHKAVEILDLLLALSPRPERFHESWPQMAHAARKHFLGIPPHVRAFLQHLGLQPEEEAAALQRAQLQISEDYPRRIKSSLTPILGYSPTPEQQASYLLRQLWAGSLEFDEPEDQIFFDAVMDLLLLPPSSPLEPSLHAHEDPGSIGFASNPKSKGGIFDLRYKVGDHYPLTQSAKWVKLFKSRKPFSAKSRLTILSQAVPLLNLQWLHSCPDIRFHPWYNRRLINISFLLQRLLLSEASFTFDEIISTLSPELHFIIQERFKSDKNDVEDVLKAQTNVSSNLSPIERRGANLTSHKNGKSILTILREWDEEHSRCILTPPLCRDDAATEWVASIAPAEYGPEILARMLILSTHFAIDPKKINSNLWSSPKILTDLFNARAPLDCLRQVVAFRLGVPFQRVTLERITATERRSSTSERSITTPESSGTSPSTERSNIIYKISGLRGNTGLLCELIPLFFDATTLSLENNGLRSLKPLVQYLNGLSSLVGLSLKANPIHNPCPLSEFTQLKELNIENTGLPDIYPKGIKELIAREKRVKVETIKLLEEIRFFSSGFSGEYQAREQRLSRQSPPDLLRLIQNNFTQGDRSDEDMDTAILALERLAEHCWLDTLALDRQTQNLSCDALFDALPNYDPREVAYKLLFAIKYKLSHGTNRDTLCFVDNVPSMRPDCLSRLDVANVYLNPDFLPSLSQFTNLYQLSLVDTKLTSLDDLPILGQLRILNLKKNAIKTLKGLRTKTEDRKFPELNVLILAENKITHDIGIRYLLELDKLTLVDLRCNLLDQMPNLGNLRLLQRLDLTENNIPLTQLMGYKDSDNFKYKPQRDTK